MQGFLDSLIINAEKADVSQIIYHIMGVCAIITAVIFCLIYGKKLKISFLQRFFIVLTQISSMLGIMALVLWAHSGFKTFGGNELTVTFTWVPIIAFVFSKIAQIDFLKVSDLMAFPPLIVHCIARFGCVFTGCCCGFESKVGIYNIKMDQRLFPIQIVESLLTIVIIVLLLRLEKTKYYRKGILTPVMLILYGCTRCITEFAHDNTKVLCGLSWVAIYSLAMIIVGTVMLYIIVNQSRKKEEPVCNK